MSIDQITADSILAGKERVSRGEIFDYFRKKNVLFEDKKFEWLRNVEASSFSLALAVFIVVGIFGGVIACPMALKCAPNPTVAISSYFSSTAAVTIALSITAIVARIKKNKYLKEELDRTSIQTFLQNVKKAASDALFNFIEYPDSVSYGVQQKIQRTVDALRNL